MLAKAKPTTSSLNLVSSEVTDSAAVPDGGIKMADLVESLDTRELDLGEGEEIDYEGNCLGVIYNFFSPLNFQQTWTRFINHKQDLHGLISQK